MTIIMELGLSQFGCVPSSQTGTNVKRVDFWGRGNPVYGQVATLSARKIFLGSPLMGFIETKILIPHMTTLLEVLEQK